MGRITETHDAVVIVATVYPNTWVKNVKTLNTSVKTVNTGKNSKNFKFILGKCSEFSVKK